MGQHRRWRGHSEREDESPQVVQYGESFSARTTPEGIFNLLLQAAFLDLTAEDFHELGQTGLSDRIIQLGVDCQ